MTKINQSWPWPKDVALRGTFAEEIKEQRKLERNPAASPLPEAAPTRLLAPKQSSDDLRMGAPLPVSENGDATPQTLTHVILRRILHKRRSKGWTLFGEAVEAENLEELPASRREQMRAMLRREEAMLQLLDRYNDLAEGVYTRLLSESKG